MRVEATMQPQEDRKHWPVRRFKTFAEADAADRAQYAAMTPAERLAMVDELTRTAYGLALRGADERELSRHVERLVRRQG